VSAASPSFAEWLALSDRERSDVQSHWNTYSGDGEELVLRIAADFREKYGHVRGVEVHGPGIYHGGSWVISVRHPFVFDRRMLPTQHLGIHVHSFYGPELPPEFQEGTREHTYVWAPPNYERFVDRCGEQMREQLGRPDMSRDEMLSALVGMPFGEFVEICRAWVREGRIAPFE
jgi:hypothetical protein